MRRWGRHVAACLAVGASAIAFRHDLVLLAGAMLASSLSWVASASGRSRTGVLLALILAAFGFLLPYSALDERAWALALAVILLLEVAWHRGGLDPAVSWGVPAAAALLLIAVFVAKAAYLPLRLSLGRPQTALTVVLAYGSIAALLALVLASTQDDGADATASDVPN